MGNSCGRSSRRATVISCPRTAQASSTKQMQSGRRSTASEAKTVATLHRSSTKVAFGASLRDLRLRHDSVFRIPGRESQKSADEKVPEVLHALVYYLCCRERFKAPFIFRSDGNSRLTDRLQQKIIDCVARGEPVTCEVIESVEGIDPLSVATILKRFLTMLHEPLLTYDVCEQLLRLKEEGASNEIMLQLIVAQLPSPNCATIAFVLRFLALIVQYQDYNHITLDAIGILFSSSMFRIKYESEHEVLKSIQERSSLIRLLVSEVSQARVSSVTSGHT